MKRLINIFTAIFAIFLLLMPAAHAQNVPFTGTIVFDVKTDEALPEMAKAMTPKVMTYRFSKDLQSMKLDFQMAEQKTIYNPATKEAKILMNVIGQKIVITQAAADLDELRKQQGETVDVKETNETKTIAGYLCKKTIITKKTKDGKETPSNIYFTDAIDVSKFKLFNAFPEIKGFPLEFSIKNGKMDFMVIARSVTKESVSPSEFVVGSDYKEMTVAELQKFFGGSSLFGK